MSENLDEAVNSLELFLEEFGEDDQINRIIVEELLKFLLNIKDDDGESN